MREKRTGDFVGAVFGNIVALVVVNTVLLWRQWTAGVILESWVDILWAANLSIAVQIVGNFLLVFFRPGWFQALMRLLFAAAGLLSLIVFSIVFPLDFGALVGDWLNTALRIVIVVGIGVTFIVCVVELVRTLAGGARAAAK